MNQTSWLNMVLLAVFLIIASASVLPAAPIKADRKPLTYRDSGLYCNLQFWHCHEPKDDGVTNMLTQERAVSAEAPWSFYIVQAHVAQDAEAIKRMAANGKRIILRAEIGRVSENPNVDQMEQKLVEILKGLDTDWLYAITLGEEHVFWSGWDKALTELYHRAKKRWPSLPVYQWWTPMEVPDARAKSGWVALPADGWVIDIYGLPREVFEKKVVMALETGKPLIHIVWSSPDWPEYCGAKSWDEGGRRVFDDQMEICRAYNVPVAHFCTQGAISKDGKTVEQIRWGWHAVHPVARDWYRQIEMMAENNRRLPDTAVGYRTLNKKLFDWAHDIDTPRDISFTLDKRGRKQLSVRVNPAKIPLKPGEHSVDLGDAAKYFKVTCMLDESSADLQPDMSVKGAAGKTVSATLVFKIEPVRPLADLAVTADIYAHNSLGGAASVSSSSDGKKWSEPLSSDPKQPNHSLTVRRDGDPWKIESEFVKDPLWIQIKLNANAGVVTNTAAKLNAIVLSAAVEPPLN